MLSGRRVETPPNKLSQPTIPQIASRSAITKSYGTLSKVTVQGTEIIQIVMYLLHATHCCIYLKTLLFPRSEFCLHYQQV